jgi:hypothetical protein
MNLESIMLNEISLPDKEKYYIISIICGMYKNKSHGNKEHRMVASRARGVVEM